MKETLGRESDGWTDHKARAELDARLVDVRREGLTASSKTTFGEVADEWLATYPKAKRLKVSTVEGYRSIVDRHLKPVFGHLRVGDLDVHHLERYVAQALDAGSAPRTVNTHLNVVHAILKAARRRRLIRENVAELVERPAAPRLSWTILTPAELARVDTAFHQLAADDDDDRIWVEQARVVFRVVAALGLRRGEVLGLRWKNVLLADPAGPRIRVAETIVHGRADTPKSAASERTLAIARRSPPNSSTTAHAAPTTPTTTSCSATRRRGRPSTTSATRRR